MARRRQSWRNAYERLRVGNEHVPVRQRIVLGLGVPIALFGLQLLLAARRADDADRVWWLVAVVVWLVVFFAGYAYLLAWAAVRARHRRGAARAGGAGRGGDTGPDHEPRGTA